MNVLEELRYCWLCAKRPASGFDGVKWRGRGSVGLGLAIVAALFFVMAAKANLTGFIFNFQNPDKFSVVSVFLVYVGGFGAVFAAHYAASSLLPDEATVRQLFITLTYALIPFILSQAAFIVASNILSAKMGVFLNFIVIIGVGWSAIEFLAGAYQTHRLPFPLVLANVALTFLGTVIILFFILLLYSLFQQVYTFFFTIFSELAYRL